MSPAGVRLRRSAASAGRRRAPRAGRHIGVGWPGSPAACGGRSHSGRLGGLHQTVRHVDPEAVDARSNQNRRIARTRRRPPGCRQSKSGCPGSNRCRYHWPGVPSASVTRVQAGPPKIDSPVGSAAAVAVRSPFPSRKMIPGPLRRPGRGRAAPPGTRRAGRGVVGHHVHEDRAGRARGRRRASGRTWPGRRTSARCRSSRRRRSRVGLRRGVAGVDPDAGGAQAGDVVQVLAQALEVADPVPVGVREGAQVDLVDDRVPPPRPLARPPPAGQRRTAM